MPNQKKSKEQEGTQALTQNIALSGAASADPEFVELQKRFLKRQLQREDEEHERTKKLLDARIQAAKMNHARADAEKRACSHRRQDMSWCVNGQVNSDGRATAFCLRCSSQWVDTPREGTGEKPIPPDMRVFLQTTEDFGNALGGQAPIQKPIAPPIPVSA